MKIYIPNLKRRPDKKIATWTGLVINGYEEGTDFTFVPSQDSSEYISIRDQQKAFKKAGWERKDELPDNFHMPQLGAIWSYLEILKGIVHTNEIGILMLDDHFLVPKEELFVSIEKFKCRQESILNLKEPTCSLADNDNLSDIYMTPFSEVVFYEGYQNNFDDGLLFEPEAAKQVIELLLNCAPEDFSLWKIIRNNLSSICLTTANTKGLCLSIGSKDAFDSDFRIGDNWQSLVV